MVWVDTGYSRIQDLIERLLFADRSADLRIHVIMRRSATSMMVTRVAQAGKTDCILDNRYVAKVYGLQVNRLSSPRGLLNHYIPGYGWLEQYSDYS